MSNSCPDQVVLGPSSHGVRGYAADLGAAVHALEPDALLLPVADAAQLMLLAERGRPLHLHVTDHLLGSTPAEAAEVVEAVAARCDLSVTLHDVPQPSDGPGRMERRAAAYGRMGRAASWVVVSSEHERALLRDHVDPGVAARAQVVPLASARPEPGPAPAPAIRAPGLRVLVAGWVYPGKGHLEAAHAAVRAAATTQQRGEVEVVAVGGAARGHERELDDLRRDVAAAGAHLTVTGVLSRAEYRSELAGVGVPVVAHQHVSASRTLLEWAEHGRRAIVLRSRYTVEMDALRPGLIELVEPEGLADAVRAAWDDPSSTWLRDDADLRPDLADAARAHVQVWRAA